MRESHRTPGYSYRRSGITNIEEFAEDQGHQFDVHGDARNGEPSRRPTPKDARKAMETPKDSPLK